MPSKRMPSQSSVRISLDDSNVEAKRTVYFNLVRLENMLNGLSSRESRLAGTPFRCSIKKKTSPFCSAQPSAFPAETSEKNCKRLETLKVISAKLNKKQ